MTGRDPDLDSELAEARLDEAARSRRRRREEIELGEMEATMASVLAGAAVAGRVIGVETTEGRRHEGRVVGLGADVVVLERVDGRRVAIRTSSLCLVRRATDTPVDERASVAGSTTMHEVVASFVGSGRRVTLVCTGGVTVVGELRWYGDDVAGVRSADDPSNEVLVYLASLSEVSSSTSS